MLKPLKRILELQELDMKMLRLMRLKNERKKELTHIQDIKEDLNKQLAHKEHEILVLKKDIRVCEGEIQDCREDMKSLEEQQGSVKKIEDFNALTQKISQKERERHNGEQKLSDLQEKLAAEEEVLQALKDTLESTLESSAEIEEEIDRSVALINEEGQGIHETRIELAKDADTDVLAVYERLFGNKKDRVVVPLENRTCSGCHIVVTAQHENLVRKGEKMVFCEYCSRIHYWQESVELEGTVIATKRRRRKASVQ